MPFRDHDADMASHIKDLVVNDHTLLEDTPLLLAIYFDSRIASGDECLFEVLADFGYDDVSAERHLFQVQFGPTANFPMPADHRLRLFLTNPVECQAAVDQGWEEIRDLRRAIAEGESAVVYHAPGDARADRLLAMLREQRVAA